MQEARLRETETGLVPEGDGWFVLNLREASWTTTSARGGTWVDVEGEERRLRQWDYFHCPPGTAHITVGAGEEPCPILMVGARTPGKIIDYLVDEVAAGHGVSVAEPTRSPREAYADLGRTFTPARAPWPPP